MSSGSASSAPADPPAPGRAVDAQTRSALEALVAEERLRNARRINLIRLGGASAFFALFLVLGVALNLKTWQGNLRLFTLYWLLTCAFSLASRRFAAVARHSNLAIAFVDMPMVFFLQWATFPGSQPSGVAGFTVGLYAVLVMLTTFSLEASTVALAAAVGTVLEGTLQHLAGVDAGAIAASGILLGLTAVGCVYAQRRMMTLLERAVEDARLRRELKDCMARADQLASVGTLAAGVAHDVNSPMTAVLWNLDIIEVYLKKLGALEGGTETLGNLSRAIRDTREGGERVRRLARDLTTLARSSSIEQKPVRLQEIVTSAVNVARYEIQKRAQLVTDLRQDPQVLGDASRLGQLFVNLLVNAAQAIPEGHSADHAVTVSLLNGSAGRAVVEVRDTGSGIPANLQAHLFEPFFTTKPVGEGTGLGLSICQEIATAHGGNIEVLSEEGRGSLFRVSLPALEQAESGAPGR